MAMRFLLKEMRSFWCFICQLMPWRGVQPLNRQAMTPCCIKLVVNDVDFRLQMHDVQFIHIQSYLQQKMIWHVLHLCQMSLNLRLNCT